MSEVTVTPREGDASFSLGFPLMALHPLMLKTSSPLQPSVGDGDQWVTSSHLSNPLPSPSHSPPSQRLGTSSQPSSFPISSLNGTPSTAHPIG